MAVTSVKTAPQSLKKLAVAGVLALAAAYIFASLAIDRGNLFYYALAVASVFIAGRYFWQAIRTFKK